MKKLSSILISLLMLATMVHFSVAEHFCQGNLAASKISLSGKLASCGMADENIDNTFPGNNLKSHCCDDVVRYIGINNNYTPSYSFVSEFFQYKIQVFSLPIGLPVISSEVLKSLYTNVSPPGVLMSTNVDLSDICIFRI